MKSLNVKLLAIYVIPIKVNRNNIMAQFLWITRKSAAATI